MTSGPAVSVIMPVRNAARFLREAVDSVLNQSFAGFELIAIDDGSTDESTAILAEYAARDPRVHCVFEPHRGLVATLNHALELARAPLIARMDADDVSLAQRLERQVDYLTRRPDCVAVGSDVLLTDADGAPLTILHCNTDSHQIEAELLTGRSRAIVHAATLIRRDPLLAVGGYHAVWDGVEDLDLFLRLATIGRLANIPEVLYRYRQHHDSVCARRTDQLQQLAVTLVAQVRHERGLASLRPDTLPDWRGLSAPARHHAWALWAKGYGDRATAFKHVRLARRCGLPLLAAASLALRVSLPRDVSRRLRALVRTPRGAASERTS